MSRYRFTRSFADEPNLSKHLFQLIELVFPEIGITAAAENAKKLGAPWETASTPFMKFQDDIAITHVGVLEIPMRVMGENVTVGGIHGVCTHPEFRRRGYYREVMEEILDYCDSCYQTLVLTTSQPELYELFGFRVVKEHNFKSKCNSTGSVNGFRLLNFSEEKDIKLLQRLLSTREPVSNIVGVVNEKSLFCVNEGRNSLYYALDLDAIVAMEIEGTKLKLFDIVGTKIPSLAAILSRISQPIEEVEIYFSPERLEVDVEAFPYMYEETVLMVRGVFPAEFEKFMLPRSARC
ncbi:MAG: GNAT family N-acetyltransferase [Nostocaceae cyanobacterium]|nr:GNAT family N-acetyltransferase [Nostocaceae cyanobacterium]